MLSMRIDMRSFSQNGRQVNPFAANPPGFAVLSVAVLLGLARAFR
jgi:hypothetical protein